MAQTVLSAVKSIIEKECSDVGPVAETLQSFVSTLPNEQKGYQLLANELGDAISTRMERNDTGTEKCGLCRWFYGWFQTGNEGMQLFVLRYVPVMVWLYLSRSAVDINVAGFEACLKLICNDFAAQKTGTAFSIPDLAVSSDFHSASDAAKAFAFKDCDPRSPSSETEVLGNGVVKPVERPLLCVGALQQILPRLHLLTDSGLLQVCTLSTRLATTGCRWVGKASAVVIEAAREERCGFSPPERTCGQLLLPSELYQMLARLLGYCLVTSSSPEVRAASASSVQALEARATFDLVPDSLLLMQTLLPSQAVAAET